MVLSGRLVDAVARNPMMGCRSEIRELNDINWR